MKTSKNQLIKHPMIKHPRNPRNNTPNSLRVPEGYVSTKEIAERCGRTSACVLAHLNRLKAPKAKRGKDVYWDGNIAEEYLKNLTADLFDYLPNGYVDVATALEISGFNSSASLTMLFKRGKIHRVRYREDAAQGRKTRYGYNLLDLERHLGLTSNSDRDTDDE